MLCEGRRTVLNLRIGFTGSNATDLVVYTASRFREHENPHDVISLETPQDHIAQFYNVDSEDELYYLYCAVQKKFWQQTALGAKVVLGECGTTEVAHQTLRTADKLQELQSGLSVAKLSMNGSEPHEQQMMAAMYVSHAQTLINIVEHEMAEFWTHVCYSPQSLIAPSDFDSNVGGLLHTMPACKEKVIDLPSDITDAKSAIDGSIDAWLADLQK